MEKNYRDSASYLCDTLNELMNEWGIEAADIHHETKIPYSTLTGYIKNHVKAPLLNRNILALSQYFRCTIEYLVFGIGEEPREEDAILARKDSERRKNKILDRQKAQIRKKQNCKF